VLAAGADFRAPPNGIPCRIGPLDLGIGTHSSMGFIRPLGAVRAGRGPDGEQPAKMRGRSIGGVLSQLMDRIDQLAEYRE